jgi:CRP-like cAMP-binding protein
VCSLDAYADLCYHRPKFGLVLSWLMAEDALGCAEHVADAGRRTPVERIVRFLLGIHSRLRIVGRAGERGFDIPFSQEVMSDALGLSVPHLNRTLAKLRRDGLISVSGRRLDFSDMKSAQVLAQFQPLMPARIPPHYRY